MIEPREAGGLVPTMVMQGAVNIAKEGEGTLDNEAMEGPVCVLGVGRTYKQLGVWRDSQRLTRDKARDSSKDQGIPVLLGCLDLTQAPY